MPARLGWIAIVLGKRGMAGVHLADAAGEIGGSVRWISQLPGLGEWRRLIDYRTIQLDRLPNVETISSTRLDYARVLDYGAEIVVVATGSHWATTAGAVTTWTGFLRRCAAAARADARADHLDHKPIGERVTVFDSEGYFMGYSLAERLAREGRRVTLVTNHHQLSPYSHLTSEGARVNRGIRELGVEVVTDHVPARDRGEPRHCPRALERRAAAAGRRLDRAGHPALL